MVMQLRTCIGCGEKKTKSEMIRVGAVGGGVAITGPGKHPGRGAYVCPSADCLRKARKKGSLSRKLRMNVTERLYEELELLIEDKQRVSIG